MSLFNRAQAPTGMLLDGQHALHAYLGTTMVWDATRSAFVAAPRFRATAVMGTPAVHAHANLIASTPIGASATLRTPTVTATSTLAAEAFEATATMSTPAVHADANIQAEAMTGSAQMLAGVASESSSWSVSAVVITATATMLTPVVSANASRQPAAFTATAEMLPAVVTATGSVVVAPPPMTASAAMGTPVVSAGSKVTAVAMTAAGTAGTPTVSGSSTVSAVAMTATAAMGTPTVTAVQLKSMKAILNTLNTLANSATPSQLTGFVADTSSYPDSVVTSNAIVINGAGTATFTIQGHMPGTNSTTGTVHLRKNGVQIGPTYVNNPGGTGAGATMTDPFGGTFTVSVSNGDLITMWASTQASTSNRREFAATTNWFRVTP